jgi:hypothetical protein
MFVMTVYLNELAGSIGYGDARGRRFSGGFIDQSNIDDVAGAAVWIPSPDYQGGHCQNTWDK